MVRITESVCGKSHVVHKSRIRKAQLKLGRREIGIDCAKLGGFGCVCSHRCGESIPITFAEELRSRLFEKSSEQEASNAIISWICGNLPRGKKARYVITDGTTRYSCCAATYIGVLGVIQLL